MQVQEQVMQVQGQVEVRPVHNDEVHHVRIGDSRSLGVLGPLEVVEVVGALAVLAVLTG